MRSVVASALAPVILLWSSVASAHDASAWGGLFRSSDQGATWFLASPGAYPMAAIALAVSSTDANHLLLATDAGVLRSRNGGRDWTREAPSVLRGAVFAAAFDADGRRALVATGGGLFRSDADPNGGEEFLSYMNIGEALVVKGGKEWQAWDKSMTDNLTRIQDKDGSWSGHHCITGKTFCTATALLVLMADRAPVPVAAKMKGGR